MLRHVISVALLLLTGAAPAYGGGKGSFEVEGAVGAGRGGPRMYSSLSTLTGGVSASRRDTACSRGAQTSTRYIISPCCTISPPV